MSRGPQLRAALGAVLVLVLVSTACVTSYRKARDDREAYLACVEEHPDQPQKCDDLAIKSKASRDTYGDEAERNWGCEHTPDRCRIQRPEDSP